MKRLLVSVLFVISNIHFAQWTSQSTSTTTEFNTIQFFDQEHGWALGISGSIKTSNGGASWMPAGSSYGFKKVSIVDQNTAFAIVGEKQIYVTTNGGSSWSPKSSPWITSIGAIQFLSSTLGFAGGSNGYIFKTTNGGSSWIELTGGNYFVSDIYFSDANNGWACRWGGQISRTTDGGSSWTTSNHGSNDFYNITAMGNTAFAAGANGSIYRTTNGGASWTSLTSGTSNTIYKILTLSTTHIRAAGSGGTIIHSTDGGNSWTREETGTSATIEALCFLDENTGWASGTGGTVLKYSFTPPAAEINLTNPSGGEDWLAGSVKNITWTSSGIDNIKIEYSTNNGTTWLLVSPLEKASAGTYSWTLPSTLSAQCKVKISDAADESVFDILEGTFTIYLPSLSINSPNGGETWEGGSSHNIIWNSSRVANVKIEYTINNGISWTVLTASTASTGSYNWILPVGISSAECRIKIIDLSNTDLNDISEGAFTITSPTVDLTSPNTGDTWAAGTLKHITWTSTYINNVKLEFTTDNGQHWSIITASTPANTNTYSWTVPWGIISEYCKVRISDENSLISDESPAFKIFEPSVVITSPNGGENWLAGSTRNIIWTSSGVTNVKLEYTTDNGSTWNLISASYPAASSTYSWVIPEDISSNNCKIKITHTEYSLVSDESNGIFAVILPPSIKLISPNGSETLVTGSSRSIQWQSVNVQNIKIEFSTDNGLNWAVITASTPASPGSYLWTIPNTPSANCKIKISDAADISLNDVSNNVFVIAVPVLNLTAPKGGEDWPAGSLRYITWTSSNVETVKIEYTVDGGNRWDTIKTNYPANIKTYSWFIPNKPSVNCAVRIIDELNSAVKDSSENTFTISGEPTLTLMTPNGGELMQIGKEYFVNWTAYNVPSVKLYYSTNSGGQWTYFGTSNPGSNTFRWQVNEHSTLSSSEYCKIKIVSSTNSGVSDISDENFTICKFKLLFPLGGESWTAGSIHDISWSSTVYGKTKLEYSNDNGANWLLVKDSIQSVNNKYSFAAPEFSSDTYRIKISLTDNPEINDSTKTSFSVYALQLLSLTSGESIRQGTTFDIKWVSPGLSGIKLEYTTDNGSRWATIISYINAGTGHYLWEVPLIASTQCKIKISNTSNPDQTDISDTLFTIYNPSMVLNSPNGGEVFVGGSTKNISWTSGYSKHIRIEYTFDNGTNWLLIADSIMAESNPYAWEVPSMNSTRCKIRITDLTNNITDISNSNFTITMTGVTILSPNGSEIWQTGSQHNITWLSSNIQTMKIDFSTNNGSSWTPIPGAQSVPAEAGAFNWTVPSVFSSQCKIRISSTVNQNLTDQSDNVFSVSTLVVTAPAINDKWPARSSQVIKWTSQNIANVKIEYSSDSGTTWNNITNSTPASPGTLSWNVPNIHSDYCRLRISDVSNSSISSTNAGAFSIYKDRILVKSPNGSENWQAGKEYNITWNSYNVSRIKLYYSTNNGLQWNPIQFGLIADSGKYLWKIPSNQSENCRVKIADVDNPANIDSSNSKFTISNLKVTIPNGGEMWEADSVKEVTWASEYISKIKIEYTSNKGKEWHGVVNNLDANTRKYLWHVPKITSSECKLRISSADNIVINDTSDNYFTISNQQRVVITSPAGREKMYEGYPYVISWVPTNVSKITILFSSDDIKWFTIVSNYDAGKKSFTWTPSTATFTGRIRIINSQNPQNMWDTENFMISNTPLLSVDYPNGAEKFEAGKECWIQWTSWNIMNIKLQYKTGNVWETIAENVNAYDRKFKWIIPPLKSANCKIRAICEELTALSDDSDNSFEVVLKDVNLISPNGGELILANSQVPITWKKNKQDIQNISLFYSDNNGLNWKMIARNISAKDQIYNWSVPAKTSKEYIVKIVDSQKDGPVYDISEGIFSVYTELEERDWTAFMKNMDAQYYYVLDENKIAYIKKVWENNNDYYYLYTTTNGGLNWERIDFFYSNLPKLNLAKDHSGVSGTIGPNIFIFNEASYKRKYFESTRNTQNYQVFYTNVYNFNNSYFLDENVGYAIGKVDSKEGLLVKTTDGGETWTENFIPEPHVTGKALIMIGFCSPSQGWILSEDKKLYWTNDGGNTWATRGTIPGSSTPNYMCYLNEQTGFCLVSNIIYRTTNAGSTWSAVCYGQAEFTEVSFINNKDGYVIGKNGILHGTTDGGINWINLCQSINAFNLAGLGWLGSTPYVTDTSTGKVFTLQNRKVSLIEPKSNSQLTPGEDFEIKWDNTQNVKKVAVKILQQGREIEWRSNSGDKSKIILNASDKRATISVPLPSGPIDIYLMDELNESKIYSKKTITIGSLAINAWTQKVLGNISDFQLLASNNAYQVSDGKLYFSSNFGQRWDKKIDSVVIGENRYNLRKIFFINDDLGYMCAIRYESWPPSYFSSAGHRVTDKLLKTTDGGLSWTEQFSETTPGGDNYSNFGLIYFLNESTGFVKYKGDFMKTTDGGISFTKVNDYHPIKILIQNSGRGWLVTNGNKLLTTSDYGSNWSVKIPSSVKDICMLNSGEGWITGINGSIKKTTDYGVTWTEQNSNTYAELTSVYFVNSSTGYVIGSSATYSTSIILKTTNGGSNWKTLIELSNFSLRSISCFTENTIYVLADPCVLYSTTGGEARGVVKENKIDYEMPKTFTLYQNYPNPFNPSTTIKYELPKDSRVNIEIYSMLGEKISEFVNEFQQAGYYTKIWDAGHLASGIYLLRIDAESIESKEHYIKTVKMVLVK